MNSPDSAPAKKSLFGVFFLILFFGLGFVITGIINNQLRDQQTIKSKAAGPYPEPACTSRGGECQAGFSGDRSIDNGATCTLSDGRSGKAVINACPSQPETVRCCVPNAAPTPAEQNATASMTVFLEGIGANADIVDQTRTARIKIYDITKDYDAATYSASDTLTYDRPSGRFINPNFNFGSIPQGEYQMVIQIDTYLDEQLKTTSGDTILSIESGIELKVASVTMKAGDIAPDQHGDNYVNIIDYNALIGCMDGAPPGSCLNKKFSDLNNDGKVDQKDLDILMLNFGDKGFAFQTDQFKCEPDPTCGAGKETIQLCSLLCTRKSLRS